MILKSLKGLFCLALFSLMFSCVDQEFDAPPAQIIEIPDAPEVNSSIAELKAQHVLGQITEITEDIMIKGIIVANDETGNFYKTLVIQDESAGISISINATDLYNLHPIGMEMYINCNGLIMADFAGTISIGGSTFINNSGNPQLGGIEESLLTQYVFRGLKDQELPILNRNINELSNSDISSIVQISDLEFIDAQSNVPFADAINLQSINLTLADCDENTILLRSSGYSNFASELTPGGNGTITAIYSVFNQDKQLFIMDPEDIEFNGDRCDGQSGGGDPDPDPMGTNILNETFSSQADFDVLNIPGWTNIAEVGSDEERWYKKSFDDDQYAEATAFQSNDDENILWLITPAIEIDGKTVLSFTSAQHHWEQDGFSVWISNDFDGDVEDASWQTIDCTLPTENNDWYEKVESGNVNLNSYFSAGEVHVAFKYEGSNAAGETGTYQIHEVIITQE